MYADYRRKTKKCCDWNRICETVKMVLLAFVAAYITKELLKGTELYELYKIM